MRHSRSGFTLLEVVIVLVIGVILTSIAMTAFGGIQGRMAVKQARGSFASLHARARALAIETGDMTRLSLDTGGDSVWIVRDGTALQTVHFDEVFGVDVRGAATQIQLCMNARGFAEPSCNSFTSSQTITFAAGADTASLLLRPLGQLSY